MNDQDVFFVIPTYRLRDVGETVKPTTSTSGAMAMRSG